ncbi:diacylglycerol/polyprenol kinase family protein [Thermococcus thioreducens]|uniref:Dolichol kinase n=1 Tax=Thermococcus thioreducens TaxID=277988 RepID=A0A1I0NXB2_9EURY|nr:diacylglycerol/polyprenol kinase family protein [Thermococcus thioreducens]ASJ11458.1 phosphatidate cytidylyltransferase [Thermococcus thioreducens]SEW06377.1 Dolichol kinase [Thermococcus thioreducens]
MSMKNELKRKSLHLTGLLVPVSYLLFGREVTLTLIGVAFFLFVVLEPFRIIEELRDSIKRRLKIYVDNDVFERVEVLEKQIREITREHERYRVAAHIYFAAAAFIIVYFFPMEIAIGAITVATVGDALAAIVGKSLGRHRFKNGKSLEGSAAYFFSGLLTLWPLVGPLLAVLGSFTGMLVEFYGFPPGKDPGEQLDDNFSNQLAIAVVLYIAGIFLA